MMTFKATVSCDQPGCEGSYRELTDRVGLLAPPGWTVEDKETGIYYTCPNHGENEITMEMRGLAAAGQSLLLRLKLLDHGSYYVCGIAKEGDPHNPDALLHIHPYDYDEDEGPRVVISQSGRSFRIEVQDADGMVLIDEDSDVWYE